MNEEILQNIWSNLSSKGKTNSDFETWKTNFVESEDIQTNVYNYLKENNLTQSSQQDWTINTMGKTSGSADATPTGEPVAMESESDGGSLVYIKPENDEEAISSVKNIRKGINENSPEVIGAIAEEYFNLDNFERFRKDDKTSPGNFSPSKYRGTVFHWAARLQEEYRGEDFYKNTEEEDLKRYFESATVDGDFTKYEQYKEYQALIAEGKTPQEAFNLDWVDESTKSNAVAYRKKQRTQQYIADIDDDEVRESAEIAAEEDVFDRYMNTKAGEFDAFWKTLSNDEKAYCEKKRQEMRDKYYANRGLVDNQKTLLKG